MSNTNSFTKYRNSELLTSDESDDESAVVEEEQSVVSNNTTAATERNESVDSEIVERSAYEEIAETESEIESDDDIIIKRKTTRRPVIESTDDSSSSEDHSQNHRTNKSNNLLPAKTVTTDFQEDSEEDEKKAIYSPPTRRSIHGFRMLISSEDEAEESFLDEDVGTPKKSMNSNCIENSESGKIESREITKFSKIYESKSTINHSLDTNKTINASINFDSSIANKMSSTISGNAYSETNKMENDDKNDNSIEVVDNRNEIIELGSSNESFVLSTPDALQSNNNLAQPKISTAFNSTPKSAHVQKSVIPQPQFVSKEYLSRELRKLDELRTELATCESLLKADVNLPDGGAKMKDRIVKCKLQIKKQANYVANLVVDQEEINAKRSFGIDNSSGDPSHSSTSSKSSSHSDIKAMSWSDLAAAVEAVQPKYTGDKALAAFAEKKALTVERLKDIHGCLETCPEENVLADNPRGLKIELMNHQKHALAWMQWREKQKPRGGILADDMGLGKTLTMISLILAQNEKDSDDSNDSSGAENKSDKWIAKKAQEYKGGTLIICPASLLQQWEKEIENRCKRNVLNVVVHHGNNRDTSARHLAKYDVVITTYHLVARESKTHGTVFKINWERIILDEAHVIRNHKAQMSVAACELKGRCRWALTGTPVQNKEMDLYSIIKFLKCSPFDELTHWKRWIDNKSAGGQARLNTLMKSLLLRRTKIQLQENDQLFKLPEKTVQVIEVNLDKDEMNVYQRVMTFSQTLFAQFLHQRAEKENDQYYGNPNNAPAYLQTKDPNGAFYKMHREMKKVFGHDKEVKSFQILVLLLRLRQICCHCGLIDSMLEEEDLDKSEAEEYREVDLLRHLEKLQIDDVPDNLSASDNLENSRENSIVKAAARVMRKNNPVFDRDRPSSKLMKVLEILEQKLKDNNDKAIVISQWTSLLDLLDIHLKRKGYRTVSLNGTVPVKLRNEIVTAFNNEKKSTRIMLLSLTAGGVGLNLVGANHLLLMDLHWNPQLEIQAQDRIYRVGQKKPVFIYKFMVKDSVEERIKKLQDKKLELANGVLTGVKSQGTKLTMEDLKGLFGL